MAETALGGGGSAIAPPPGQNLASGVNRLGPKGSQLGDLNPALGQGAKSREGLGDVSLAASWPTFGPFQGLLATTWMKPQNWGSPRPEIHAIHTPLGSAFRTPRPLCGGSGRAWACENPLEPPWNPTSPQVKDADTGLGQWFAPLPPLEPSPQVLQLLSVFFPLNARPLVATFPPFGVQHRTPADVASVSGT